MANKNFDFIVPAFDGMQIRDHQGWLVVECLSFRLVEDVIAFVESQRTGKWALGVFAQNNPQLNGRGNWEYYLKEVT